MIVETIQAVVAELNGGRIKFIYADLYESNLGLSNNEEMKGYDTFFVYIPPLEWADNYDQQGAIHTGFPLNFFMMKKIEMPTADYKSTEVQPEIDNMREFSRQFIRRLNATDIVDKSGESASGGGAGITNVKYLSEYAWQDEHLFGVSGSCDVPIYEGKKGC